jgi:hypothetical protein
MNPIPRFFAVAFAFLAAAFAPARALAQDDVPKQIALPQSSPAATVSLELGLTKITIDYHSPAVKARKIWGELVPYQKVWRTGANDATTITIADNCKINGKDLPAGTYALFAIPTRNEWTLLFNKNAKQWGAYFYDAKQDVLRVEVKPKDAAMRERLIYTIEQTGEGTAVVTLHWEKVAVSFTIEVDVAGITKKKIDDAIAEATPKDWAVYLQAARYYYENQVSDPKAMEWIDKSIAGKESFWNFELKAKLLQRGKKTKEAIELLEKAIEMSKGVAPKEYGENLVKLRDEWKKTL